VNDYVDAGTNSSILPNSWTVLAWIKINNIKSSQSIIAFATSTNTMLKIEHAGTGKPLIYLNNENYRYFVASSWDTIKDGGWHLVTFSIPGNTINDIDNSNLYIDGIIQGAQTASKTMEQALKTIITIGGQAASNSLGGFLDDVRIYNRVLTASEIKALYEGTK
jgi:hypothetical protein